MLGYLRKHFEYLVELPNGDADAGVHYSDDSLVILRSGNQVNLASPVGVLGSVAEDVRDHLCQALGVAFHRQCPLELFYDESVLAFIDERFGLLERGVNGDSQIERRAVQLDLPLGNSRQVEQVVHELRQMRYLPAHHRMNLFDRFGVRLRLLEHLQSGEERGQGISQFMAQYC